jgi:hypothetical protein
MLRPRSPQASFYGSYLYDRIVPVDHLLRKINQVVGSLFSNLTINPALLEPVLNPVPHLIRD